MANPAVDDWGTGVPVNQADPWGAGTPVNENEETGFTGDQADEAIHTYAPGATITSAARTPAHNAQVGGVPDSQHLSDQARDFVLPPGVTFEQFRQKLADAGYPATELINEGNHVHWGWGAKPNQAPGQDPWGTPEPVHVRGWPPPPTDEEVAAYRAGGKKALGEMATPYDETNQDYQEGDLDRAGKYWSGVWNGIKGAIQGFPAATKGLIAGAVRSVGENPEAFDQEGAGLAEYGRSLASPEQRAEYDKGMAATAALGARMYAEAADDAKKYAPGADAPTQQKLAYQVTAGTLQAIPVLALGVATGDPVPAALAMGDMAFAQKYGEARAAGRTPAEAGMDATFTGLVNGSLGSVNVGLLMRPGTNFLSKTLQNAAGFGAVSVATEALQIGYDRGLVTPNMTFKEAWQRLEDAGISGMLQGAFITGGEQGLHAAVNAYMARTQPPPPRVEPGPAAAPEPPPQPVAPTSRQPTPPGPTSLQAQMRSALGLDRPGVAPNEPVPSTAPAKPMDPWGTPVPVEIPKAPAATASVVTGDGIPRRVVAPDVAVTSAGREVPVHYAVVEAGDLVPSQDQDGNPNPNYPQELQPRDRTRLVSQAQIATIAQNINPRLLDRSPNASDGAPIVAPSGVVESGNGRTLAVQRAYEQNLQSAFQYRNFLIDQGYPVEGMKAPMLVRVRTDPMSPDDRQAFVREANQAGQLGYSATERAMSDAAGIPETALELYRGGDIELAQNRPFVRAFMDKAITPNEQAGMVTANGGLSQEAIRRVRAALLAKAYADPELVGAITESQDNNIRAIGGALTDAAGDWAKIRSAAARGDIPPEMDQTANLLAAVKLVDQARASGRNVAEFVNQRDIFSGESLNPDIEAWLRLMFRNTKDWTQPTGRDKLADAIRFYAGEAQKAQVAPNLLGEAPVKPADVLALAKAKQSGQPPESSPSLRLGQDTRTYGQPGGRPGAEGPEARGGQGPQEISAQGRTETGLGPSAAGFAPEASIGHSVEQSLHNDIRAFVERSGADPKSAVETVGAIANYVRLRGANQGTETLGFWMEGHPVGATTNNREKEVKFTAEVGHALRTPGNRVISVHNHPSSHGPSGADIASVSYPGHAVMAVVTRGGDWFMHRFAATPTGRGNVNDVAQEVLHVTNKVGDHIQARLSPLVRNLSLHPNDAMDIHSRLLSEAMDGAGITDYLSNTRATHPRYRALIDTVRKEAIDVAKRIAGQGGFIRPASRPDGVYRPSGPIRFGEGIARLSGEAGPEGQQPAGDLGAAASNQGAAPPPPRPFQPRLLEEENRYERERPPFYSQLTRSVEDLKLNRAPAKDWLGVIDNLKAKGVKQEEIDWSGVKDWLGKQPGAVSKADVLQHLRENEVQVQEVERGSGRTIPQPLHDERNALMAVPWARRTAAQQNRLAAIEHEMAKIALPKFGQYTLPGGKNYRELLLTLPLRDSAAHQAITAHLQELQEREHFLRSEGETDEADRVNAEARRIAGARAVGDTLDFRSAHWDEPNVLAHIRFDDRTDANGERVLHVAEVQSDWHQAGRKRGYDTGNLGEEWAVYKGSRRIGEQMTREQAESMAALVGGHADRTGYQRRGEVPNAPLKSSWHEMAMKRLLRYAAEHGYDRLTWDTGDTNAARYDLSKRISTLILEDNASGGIGHASLEGGFEHGDLLATDHQGREVIGKHIHSEKELADTIGKEMAEKLLKSEPYHGRSAGFGVRRRQLRGLELKIGGEGMRGFYDKILPDFVRKYVKKWGAKVEGGAVPTAGAERGYEIVLPNGKVVADDRLHDEAKAIAKQFPGAVIRRMGAKVHQVDITPEMRKSLMEGQPLFQERNRYADLLGTPAEEAPSQDEIQGGVGAWRRAKEEEKYWGDQLLKGGHGTKETQKLKYNMAIRTKAVKRIEDEYRKKGVNIAAESAKVPVEEDEDEAFNRQTPGKTALDAITGTTRHGIPSPEFAHYKLEDLRHDVGEMRRISEEGFDSSYHWSRAQVERDKAIKAKADKLTIAARDREVAETQAEYYRMHQPAFDLMRKWRENHNIDIDTLSHKYPELDQNWKAPPSEEEPEPAPPAPPTPAAPGGDLFATEPGAVDARGNALPQTIIPGAEGSAVQAAKAREASTGGKMGTKVEQKPPGGLFGAQGVPGDGQLSLFEDENRYSEIPKDDRDALEKAARTGNWISRFNAQGATPEERIRNSIAGAFKAWRVVATSVPTKVRDVFRDIAGTGAPTGFSDVPGLSAYQNLTAKVRQAADSIFDIGNDLLMHVTPMSQGTPTARAAAKDFANMMRLARWHGNRMMEELKKNFTHTQLRRMWEAADEESVLRQQGQPTEGRGLSILPADERRAVHQMQADAQSVWNAAVAQGMVEGEGLPSYVPRMMVDMAGGEARRLGSDGEARSIPGFGRNVRTSTPQMTHRKYLTTGETEAAGSTKFGTLANVVKDLRTLPLATMRLREAVAGRALINRIKEIGKNTGDETVVEGHEPTGTEHKWFTIDNPAFKTWRPKLLKNEESGRFEQAVDQNGDPQWERVPIYVRGDFEGPLRAVFTTDSSKVYNALMSMKGRAMTAIMYSPLIHNMVEWGRAFPAFVGRDWWNLGIRLYFDGNAAKRDPETMTQAIMHGLVPIGHRGGYQDITSIANVDSIAAGRSWTAKILGAVPGIFSRGAQQSVYRGIDALGDLWHNTLLWDRVGDLQMGLYKMIRDDMVKKGNPVDTASYVAAHFANRYAGALPLEAMSNTARKIANLAMFSRSYTLGNLGAMKDMLTGLPRDVQAQIEASGGPAQLKGVRAMAMRKAIGIFLIDIALFYVGKSILQSAISAIAGRQDLSDIEKGYADRLSRLTGDARNNPQALLNPFTDLERLSATSENEPGRENRVLVGYDKDGTAIYGRMTVGKIGEEFTNWLQNPIQTGLSKMSPLVKPTWQLVANDAGFGKHVYDPDAKGPAGLAHNLGNIVQLYLEDQIPIDSLKSAYNVLKGGATKLDAYKTLGPLAGVTFSKGAPGGPAVGELYQMRREHDAAVAAAMPDIVAKIKGGDVAGARKDMLDLGMAPGLINYYVKSTLNPRSRLTTRSAQRLIRTAPAEERERLNSLRGGQ